MRMNDFDQAARFVAEMDPQGTVDRILANTGLRLLWKRWFPANTVPRLQSPEREADSVAECEDENKRRWLVVIEWQSRPEEAKLRTLLEECAIFFSRAVDETGKEFAVMPALAQLTGTPKKRMEDMRAPNGDGLFGRPALWELPKDIAADELEKIAAGTRSWSLLCWVPLMSGADSDIIVARWKEVLLAVVPDERKHYHLRATALILSQLGRNHPTWNQGLKKESIMGESIVMNEMRKIGADAKELELLRKHLLDAVDARFPGQMPEVVRRLISKLDAPKLLDEWFQAALRVGDYAAFDSLLRQ